MKCGIYSIVHITSQKRYVGSSNNIEARLKSHIRELERNLHVNCRLQNAWNKYTQEAFITEIIEECDVSILYEREQFFIDFFDSCNSGYNICPAAGSVRGRKHSEKAKKNMSIGQQGRKHSGETKRKISEGNKKRKRIPCSDSAKEKLRIFWTGKKRGPRTPEFCKLMSEINKGKKPVPLSEETKKRMSDNLKGKKRPPEIGQAVSAALKGKKRGPQSPDHIEKRISKIRGRKGKPRTEEQNKKVSEKLTGIKRSEETKLKMAEAARKRWATKKLKDAEEESTIHNSQ